MTKKMNSVLVVARDPELSKVLQLALCPAGFGVETAPDEAEARRLLDAEPPDVLVLDLPQQKRSTGAVIDLYRRRCRPGPPVLILIATDRLEDSWRARFQPDFVIYKPFDIRFLVRRMEALIQANGLSEPAN